MYPFRSGWHEVRYLLGLDEHKLLDISESLVASIWKQWHAIFSLVEIIHSTVPESGGKGMAWTSSYPWAVIWTVFQLLPGGVDTGWTLACSVSTLPMLVQTEPRSKEWQEVSHSSIFSIEGRGLAMVSRRYGTERGSPHLCFHPHTRLGLERLAVGLAALICLWGNVLVSIQNWV